MKLDVISYQDFLNPAKLTEHQKLELALLQNGIVGVRDVPDFEKKSRAYVAAAKQFSALPEEIRQQYRPDRDNGDNEGK